MVILCHTVRCLGAYLCLYSPVYEGFVIGQVVMGVTSPSVTLALYIIGTTHWGWGWGGDRR